ncbi:spore germination protein [Peribacillus frigoritolerans]|uniref:spore germination protein n=1 Tax=Peribacillus frigoritolerans TaxID=450367 RepID=UPI003F85174A
MWKTIVSYLPESQVFIQAFIVFFIPNLISKLFNRFATQRMSDENESLSLVQFQVGKQSKKALVVAYIKDIVDPELVQEVENRIKKIDIDCVPE